LDQNEEFRLETNASGYATGAVFSQLCGYGKWHQVGFTSKALMQLRGTMRSMTRSSYQSYAALGKEAHPRRDQAQNINPEQSPEPHILWDIPEFEPLTSTLVPLAFML